MSVFTTTTTTAQPSDLGVVPVQAYAETPRPACSVVTTMVKPDGGAFAVRPLGFVAAESAPTSGMLGVRMFFTTDANAAWRPLSPQNRSPG